MCIIWPVLLSSFRRPLEKKDMLGLFKKNIKKTKNRIDRGSVIWYSLRVFRGDGFPDYVSEPRQTGHKVK